MYQLDEIDQFIINCCIKGLSYEEIANSLQYDERKLNIRITSLKDRGIVVFPGMEGEKIKEKDLKIFYLLNQGKSISDVAKALSIPKGVVSRTISNFEKLNIKIDKVDYKVQEKSKNPQIENNIEQVTNPKKDRANVENVNPLGETDTQIYKLSSQGMNQTQIAKEIGCSKQEISRRVRRMKKMGFVFGDKKEDIRKQTEKVLELIQKGYSVNEIAKMLEIGEKQVYYCITRLRNQGFTLNITRKKSGRIHRKYTTDMVDIGILEMREQGLTIKRIGELLNKSQLTIFKRIKKMKEHNIDVPKGYSKQLEYSEREKRDAEIAEMYSNGMKAKDIAEKYGVSKQLVWKAVRERGIKKHYQYIHNDKTEKRIVELYRDGISIFEISNIVKISHQTVRKILVENGIEIIKEKPVKKEVRNEIVKLANQGVSCGEIANKIGINPITVARVLRRTKDFEIKKSIVGAGKEKIAKAVFNLIESKNATKEQLEVIAEYYGIELKDVLNVAKYIDER